MKKTIYIGADHAGWELKEGLEEYLKTKDFEIVDMGNKQLVENDDYPDFGHAVAKRVVSDEGSHGIVICGNAQGICIVANKVKGIRAGTASSVAQIKAAVNGEDLNILCLSADYLPNADIATQAIIKTFLETKFSGEERHVRRIEKINDLETDKLS